MRTIEDLAAAISSLERRVSGMMRQGKVDSVDPASGTVRVRLGDGTEAPYLSPAVPYAQVAGDLSIHSPPSVGQQMTLFSPGGDMRQALALPLGFSDAVASPGDQGDTHVLTIGGVSISLDGSGVTITGDVTVIGSLAASSGSFTHDGKNVGATHTHSGVDSGPANTGAPN